MIKKDQWMKCVDELRSSDWKQGERSKYDRHCSHTRMFAFY